MKKSIFVLLFFLCFFSATVFGQKSYDGWAEKNKQNFFSIEFRGPALDLSYREFPSTPYIREYGALLSLHWKIFEAVEFGVYAGGVIIEVNDLVEKPGINHLGRVTREGVFLGLKNNPKKFFYLATTARVGHMWQLRPADGIPGGWHTLESEIQCKIGFRIERGESLVIPCLNFGARHLLGGGSKYEGLHPFIGINIFYTGRH